MSAADAAAQRPDAAFGRLADAYRRELQVHCYRLLGSLHESEDVVQETLLRAWRARATFERRSTFRAWLYKIATNACLDHLARHPRHPTPYSEAPVMDSAGGAETPLFVPWLQPYPDAFLDRSGQPSNPEEQVATKETIGLAFLVAIQALPPRQRAVLILHDVMGWSAKETALLLEGSVASVKSALQRAREGVKQHRGGRDERPRSADLTADDRALLDRYLHAHERGDINAMAQLLADEVRVTMPPHPQWFRGRDAVLRLHAQVFDPASEWYHGRWRSLATRSNRQPAAAHYCERPSADLTKPLGGAYKAQVLDVLRIEGGRIVEITSFEPRLFAAFGLPLALP